MGRSPKYNENIHIPIVKQCVEKGYIDLEIAKKLGIVESTLYEWKKKYSKFSEALQQGKKTVDDKVEQRLLKRALGYKYTETTRELALVTEKKGKKVVGESNKLVITKKVTKELVPDVHAIKFWLINRRPEKWREKKNIDLTGSVVVLKPSKIKKPKDTGLSK
jgi:transposase-like protein